MACAIKQQLLAMIAMGSSLAEEDRCEQLQIELESMLWILQLPKIYRLRRSRPSYVCRYRLPVMSCVHPTDP